MTKSYYLICDPKRFKPLASRIAYILNQQPRFYPERCFMGDINLYHSEGSDKFYGLVKDGAIKADARVLAGTLERRLTTFDSIDTFIASIHPPRYLAGFVFNLELDIVFMWNGYDNFMPLIGNNTEMYPITEDIHSSIRAMHKSVPPELQDYNLDWCLHRVKPVQQDQWANLPLYLMYATTTETILPGALAIPATYYEDIADSDYAWAEIINTIYTPLAKAYKDAQTLLNNEHDAV